MHRLDRTIEQQRKGNFGIDHRCLKCESLTNRKVQFGIKSLEKKLDAIIVWTPVVACVKH